MNSPAGRVPADSGLPAGVIHGTSAVMTWSIGQCRVDKLQCSPAPRRPPRHAGELPPARHRRAARAGARRGRVLLLRQGGRARLRRRDAPRRRRDQARCRATAMRAVGRVRLRPEERRRDAAPRVRRERALARQRARDAARTSRTCSMPGRLHARAPPLPPRGRRALRARRARAARGRGRVHATTTSSALEGVAPFIVAGARAQLQYDELSREAAALRALGQRERARLRGRPRQEAGRVGGRPRARHRLGRGRRADRGPARRRRGAVARGARAAATRCRRRRACRPARSWRSRRIDDDPVFGGARCAVVRVEAAAAGPAAIEGLSKREREIARLLVAGYSGVNVAAISGLSENTVRTYVRRLYASSASTTARTSCASSCSPEPSAEPRRRRRSRRRRTRRSSRATTRSTERRGPSIANRGASMASRRGRWTAKAGDAMAESRAAMANRGRRTCRAFDSASKCLR